MIYELKEKLTALLPAACEDIAEILNDKVTFRVDTYGQYHDFTCVTLFVGDNGRWLGAFSVSPFPGNRTVVISSDVSLRDNFRGLGVGSLLHSMRLKAMQEAGADSVMCTVANDNEVEKAILKKNGWELACSISPTASLLVKRFDQPVRHDSTA